MKIPETLEDHIELAARHVVDQDKLATYLGTCMFHLQNSINDGRAARMQLRRTMQEYLLGDSDG